MKLKKENENYTFICIMKLQIQKKELKDFLSLRKIDEAQLKD